MTHKELKRFLGLAAIINFTLLLISYSIFTVAKDSILIFWSSFHPIDSSSLELLALYAYAFWKILIFFFAIVPYIVLQIMDKKSSPLN